MTDKLYDISLPVANLELQMGEDSCGIVFAIIAKKTVLNRSKYWLFCQFFPFKIKRWDAIP